MCDISLRFDWSIDDEIFQAKNGQKPLLSPGKIQNSTPNCITKVLRLPCVKLTVQRIQVFFVLLARNSEFPKIPRESFLTAYDNSLEHPDPFTHLIKSAPQLCRLSLLVRSCNCLRVKRKPSVGGCFLSHFVHPEISPNFDHSPQHLKLEVWALC